MVPAGDQANPQAVDHEDETVRADFGIERRPFLERAVRIESGDVAAIASVHACEDAADENFTVGLHRRRQYARAVDIGCERRIEPPRDLRMERDGNCDGEAQKECRFHGVFSEGEVRRE